MINLFRYTGHIPVLESEGRYELSGIYKTLYSIPILKSYNSVPTLRSFYKILLVQLIGLVVWEVQERTLLLRLSLPFFGLGECLNMNYFSRKCGNARP